MKNASGSWLPMPMKWQPGFRTRGVLLSRRTWIARLRLTPPALRYERLATISIFRLVTI